MASGLSGRLSAIEHIVVLMMENRSFDNLLGWQFGLDPDLNNRTDSGERIYVWGNEGTDYGTMNLPEPAGERFTDINYQLFETYFPDTALGDEITMGGFVRSYVNQTVATTQEYDPRAIMHCFHPHEVPSTSALAAHFGVADPWFASAPCQTWPNRLFVHCATANGYVNNLPIPSWKVVERFPFDMPTIFDQIRERFPAPGQGWRIYFHDFPHSLLLSNLWPHLDHFHGYSRFREDVAAGELPPYSFIEPRYFPNLKRELMPNDQHPPHDVSLGEQLIAEVYNTLRGSNLWEKTLLVVLWDDHGGCYDHVPPPPAQEPDDGRSPKPGQEGFTFDRYGVRVPALLISPFIPAGIVRPPGDVPFDHTTLIKTVREGLGLPDVPLTRRDEAAPSLAHALTLDPGNLNHGPESLPMPLYAPPGEVVETAAWAPLTGYQKSLLYAAAALPPRDKVLAPLPQETPAEALPFIQEKLWAFLGRKVEE
jgi:phospholipase C